MLLLDTNIVSYIFKKDSRANLYRFDLEGSSLAISLITIAELRLWTKISQWGTQRQQEFEIWLKQNFLSLPVDDQLAQRWAIIMMSRRTIGRPIEAHDAWIAATAWQHNFPLVTHNPKDFQHIENIQVIIYA